MIIGHKIKGRITALGAFALTLVLLAAGAALFLRSPNDADESHARVIAEVEQAADSGDWQAANDTIARALSNVPGDAELLAWRQAIEVKVGQLTEANWSLCITVSQCIEDGLVLLKLELPQLAQKTAIQLTALVPDNPTGSFISGASFEQVGDLHQAYLQYEIAVTLSGNIPKYTAIHVAAAARMQMLQTATVLH